MSARFEKVAIFIILILGMVGCGDGGEAYTGGRPRTGSVGNPDPECGMMNQVCLEPGIDAPLALGTEIQFGIDYRIAGSSGPPTHFKAVNEAILEVKDQTVVKAVGEGNSGLLLVGPNEEVMDFIHLWVQKPEKLKIVRYAPTGERLGEVQPRVTLLKGDELLISIEPYAGGQGLLGQFQLDFEVDENMIQVLPDVIAGWYRVVAVGEGHSTLTFQALGISTTWEVEIEP